MDRPWFVVVLEASELPGRNSSLDWNRVLWNTLLYRPRTIRLDLAGVRFSPLDEAQWNSHTRPAGLGTVGGGRSVSEVQRKHARSFPPVHEKIIALDAIFRPVKRLDSQRCSRDERLVLPSHVYRFKPERTCAIWVGSGYPLLMRLCKVLLCSSIFRARLVWLWDFTIEVYRQKRPQLGSSPKMQ